MTLMNRSSTLFLTSCGQPSYRKSNQRRFAPTSCPHHRNQVPTSLEYAMSTARKRSVLMHSSFNAGGVTVIANVAEGAMARFAFSFFR